MPQICCHHWFVPIGGVTFALHPTQNGRPKGADLLIVGQPSRENHSTQNVTKSLFVLKFGGTCLLMSTLVCWR